MSYKIIFGAALCALLLTVASCSTSETTTSQDVVQVGEVKTVEPGEVEIAEPGEAETVQPGEAEAVQPGEAEAVQPGEVETVHVESKEPGIDDSEVIVSLGDEKLTMEQIKWRYPDPEAYQIVTLANWWIKNELLYAEAVKRGILNQPRAKFLAETGRKGGFAQGLAMQVRDTVEVSDEAIWAYYEKNKNTDSRLGKQGSLGFSHVRTGTLEEAKAVLERIKAGENINDLAKELSIDGDAKRGGIVRRMTYKRVKRRFGAEFLEAMTAAEKDELIGPVEVEVEDEDEGYEVARKTEETRPEYLPFEEVQHIIKQRLQAEKAKKAFRELVDSLNEEAADRIVKSPRLIEAEKAAVQRPRMGRSRVPTVRPRPTSPRKTD